MHYWFSYDAAKGATRSFRGDDDVWVFLSGRLVVDLGVVHDKGEGSVVLGPSTSSRSERARNARVTLQNEKSVFEFEH